MAYHSIEDYVQRGMRRTFETKSYFQNKTHRTQNLIVQGDLFLKPRLV